MVFFKSNSDLFVSVLSGIHFQLHLLLQPVKLLVQYCPSLLLFLVNLRVLINDMINLSHAFTIFLVSRLSDLGDGILEIVLQLTDVFELADVRLDLLLVGTFELRPYNFKKMLLTIASEFFGLGHLFVD